MPRLAARFLPIRERIVIGGLLVASVTAVMVLVGTALGIEALTRLYPAWGPMDASAGLCLLLMSAGLLILLLGGRDKPWLVAAIRGAAASTMVVAVASLLPEAPGPAASWPRMAANCAGAFLLLAVALMFHTEGERWEGPTAEAMAVVVAIIGAVALLSYLYGVSDEFPLGRSTAMAPSTALGLLVLAVAIIVTPPVGPLARLVASDGPGGMVARRMLPVAVLVPSGVGLLRLWGQRANLYDTEFGLAALTVTTILIFSAMTWWSGYALDRMDRARRDATRRIEAESEWRELERRRLRAVLDVLPVGVFLDDAAGRIVEMNEAARAIWGNPPTVKSLGELRRNHAWWSDTGEPLRPEDWGLIRALTRGETSLAEEIDILTYTSERKTILNYAVPIRDSHGDIAGSAAVNVDITDRKKTENELKELRSELEERVRQRTQELAAAVEELEAFSYSVSHDLRAPLRWVDGFTEALAEEYGDKLDDVGRDYLRQIRESVQRMSELIQSLLQLSRVTRAPLERADVDLSAMARDIIGGLRAEDPKRRVRCEIEPNVRAHADPRLVRIVLDNLLWNAWKFTRPRKEARISLSHTRQNGERVYVVRDNGVGFDMRYADKLFRSFERLHPSDEFEGTGVGLPLVKRIVTRHRGRVWATGKVDEGAAFYFTLEPAEEAA